MANLWADSPDYYGTTQLPLVGWALSGTPADAEVVSSGGRRSGKNAIRINDSGSSCSAIRTQSSPSPGDATLGLSFGIIFERLVTTGGRTFFAIGDGSVWHLSMAQDTDGSISWYMGRDLLVDTGGTLIEKTTFVPTQDVYYSFSIKTTINNTTGALSFKVNNVERLNGGAGYTNIDTQNAGTATWTRFGFGNSNASGIKPPRIRWCDVVVNDGTGSANNGHPGDASVLIDIPNAVNGSNTGFTPNGGTFHGDRVREIPLDNDTTYNASTAAGQRDTYVFPSLAIASGTPLSVINRMALKKTEAGVCTAVGVIYDISAATNYDSAVSLAPSETSYAYFDDIRETDPDTGVAWTVAGINDKELGVKRAT